MPNPFFSGRIPQDLLDKIKQHIAETGESRTQVLVRALAAYVNHPITLEEPPSSKGLSLEMFRGLEERVAYLEHLLEVRKESVINNNHVDSEAEVPIIADDKSNIAAESPVIAPDNNLSDLWIDINSPTSTSSNLLPLSNPPHLHLDVKEPQSDKPQLFLPASPTAEADNQPDNADRTNSQSSPPSYELLTSPELRKLTGMAQFQVDNHKRKVKENYKKRGLSLKQKKLLDSPETVNIKNPIVVNGCHYSLSYKGQNGNGKDVWNLEPIDNMLSTLSL
jgi:hypothetical protein